MSKPYAELRKLMRDNEITQAQLGRRLNRSTTYMTDRISGEQSFTMDEAYAIMALFNVPIERLHEILPPEGKQDATLAKKAADADREKEIARLAIQLVRTAAAQTRRRKRGEGAG